MQSQNCRTKHISVSKLIQQITLNNFHTSTSIYNTLQTYDKIIKKYDINPLDEIALEIYQYFVELDTFGTDKSNSNPEVRFSKNIIEVQQRYDQNTFQQPLNQNNQQINQKQRQDYKFFSFAKNPSANKKNRKNVDNKELIPTQLFKNEQVVSKSKLDIKSQRKPQISQSNKNSQSSRPSQNCVEQFFTPSSTHLQLQSSILHQYLSHKNSLRLLTNLSVNHISHTNHHLIKKIKYQRCINLMRRFFISFRQDRIKDKQNNNKLSHFIRLKGQRILEQCFYHWRDRSKLTIQQRQLQEYIQINQTKTTVYIVISRFRTHINSVKQKDQLKKRINYQLQLKINYVLKSLVYIKLKSSLQNNRLHHTQLKQLSIFLCQKRLTNSITYLQKNLTNQKQSQLHLIKKCQFHIKGHLLMNKLKQRQNFVEVYWARYTDTSKLRFLQMFLDNIKWGLEREGYVFGWIRQYRQVMSRVDQKFQFFLAKQLRKRAFNRLKTYLIQQKFKNQQIKAIICNRILNTLTYSHYLYMREQVIQQKYSKLQNKIFQNNGKRLLKLLGKDEQRIMEIKQQKLFNYLSQKKLRQFLIYFQNHYQTKTYYIKKLSSFIQQRILTNKSRIWNGLKQVLKQQIINKKLISQYLKLKQMKIKQNCFQSLKTNIFQEKLMRKREYNLNKYLKNKRFDRIIKSLKNNKEYDYDVKQQIANSFLLGKRQYLIRQFFHLFRFNQTNVYQQITCEVIQNYNRFLLTKSFKMWKFQRQSLLYNCLDVQIK